MKNLRTDVNAYESLFALIRCVMQRADVELLAAVRLATLAGCAVVNATETRPEEKRARSLVRRGFLVSKPGNGFSLTHAGEAVVDAYRKGGWL